MNENKEEDFKEFFNRINKRVRKQDVKNENFVKSMFNNFKDYQDIKAAKEEISVLEQEGNYAQAHLIERILMNRRNKTLADIMIERN